jgi:GT2 family glycosyltransferase
VVIVSYDSGAYLDSAIASVYEAAKKSKFQLFCCVVDNHPEAKDSRVASAVSFYTNPKKNLGFGAGCNVGIDICQEKFDADYILLLNPDAALKEDFFHELEKIFATAPHPINDPISPLILLDREIYISNLGEAIGVDQEDVITLIHGHHNLFVYNGDGALVSKPNGFHTAAKGKYWIAQLGEPSEVSLTWINSINANLSAVQSIVKKEMFSKANLINNAGSYLNPPFTAGDIAFEDLYIHDRWSEVQKRTAWCGACVVLSKDYLLKVGNFDEDFFLYYEDIEMSLRGIKKGFSPTFFPELFCYHGHSKSTSKNQDSRNRNVWRSRSLFVSKVYGLRFGFALFFRLLVKSFRFPTSISRLRYFKRYQLPEQLATARGILRIR